MKPVLQLALDFVDLPRALQVAEEAVAGGADWLEAGTPLIKSEGLQAIRELKARWPNKVIVADMKTMDAGRAEVETAAKAGARVVGVLGAASDATIRECVEAARNYGAEIVVDMIQCGDVPARAKAAEEMGANYVGIHLAIDEQMQGKTPWDTLREVAKAVSIPIAVAGGINSETAALALEAGASIVVVGGAITKAADATAATKAVKQAMETGQAVKSEYFVRATGPDLREMLARVSAANVSDALHRSGDIPGMRPLAPGTKMVGPAMTVRTAPGDWAKPVEAIDLAEPGDVLVIDAGNVLPACWGELATNSAIQRKLAGVVIYGAARNTVISGSWASPSSQPSLVLRPQRPKASGRSGCPSASPASMSPRATGSSAMTTGCASSPKRRPSSTPTERWTSSRRRTACARRSWPAAP